jgi:hypothetical protein
MSGRLAKFKQSDANRLFKAAMKAGVNVRVEFRPDGTIVATTEKPFKTQGCGEEPETAEQLRKLI